MAAALFALVATARCSNGAAPGPSVEQERVTLRLGVANAPALSTERGIQGFVLNMLSEGLLRVNQEGRLEPWLAESWTRSPDGLHLTIHLRKGVTFHDASPVDANAIVTILNEQLSKSLKSLAVDVESITANGAQQVDIAFKRPSSMFADALMDVQIVKATPSPVATGAFMAALARPEQGGAQIVAYDNYYLGRPSLGGLVVSSYPNVRAAWADLLRDRLDMLYEVGIDALEAMRGATSAKIYTFDRPYQFVVFLNTRSPKLQSPDVRRALNQAVDRAALVTGAMGGHGTPSNGVVSMRHWAFSPGGETFTFNPAAASATLAKPLRLKCVTVAEAPYEQISLVLKQQLKAVGVDLDVQGLAPDQVIASLRQGEAEAVLMEFASGWSLSRVVKWFQSEGSMNGMKYSDPRVDAALDRMQHSVDDEQYRQSVSALQNAIADNPPAIFLAWSDRSRAVSTRFDVKPEPGRDVLATLRTWRLATDNRNATHN